MVSSAWEPVLTNSFAIQARLVLLYALVAMDLQPNAMNRLFGKCFMQMERP